MTDLVDILDRFWGMRGAAVEPLGGGMNSETWLVRHQGRTYVAKLVPPSGAADLRAGCRTARDLANAGLVTGPPVPTTDGRLLLSDPDLALLEHVPGRELDGDTSEEQERIARILARVHGAGGPVTGPNLNAFAVDWLDPALPGVEDHPWVGRAIREVRAETAGLAVTWSLLHGDPAPEAFVHDDATGTTGLIDWAGARRGPVLYDVASAVMYLGGPQHATAFVDAYRRAGPLAVAELDLLDSFRRFRWAVQAAYFAARLAARDLTGIADQSHNEKGLVDARRGLAELGIAAR